MDMHSRWALLTEEDKRGVVAPVSQTKQARVQAQLFTELIAELDFQDTQIPLFPEESRYAS